MQTLAFLCKTFIKSDRCHYRYISLSWKYGKINNIKCLFLSQMFTISGIHLIHIHELKKLWPSNHPLCGHFRWYKYLNCRPWRTEYLFVTPLHNKRRATASRDNHWTRNRCQQRRTSTRNDVIPSVDASKVYFITSLLTQYWLACKLTCTKRNFDTHQSVTDITAAIGRHWLHKLWLGLVLGTGPVGLPSQRLYLLLGLVTVFVAIC